MPWTADRQYRPRTSAEWLAFLRERYTTRVEALGLPAPRWAPAAFTTLVFLVLCYGLSELDEALAAILDMRSARNATGPALLDLAESSNVTISPGTASSATVTVTAWDNGPVTISPSDVFRGGGSDGLAEWSPNETVTVAAGDSDDVNIVCNTVGVVLAGPNTITTRVRVPAGVVAVTNSVAATPGTAADTEDTIRAKILRGSSAAGSRSDSALRDRIAAIAGVEDCIVYTNPNLTATTVSSRTVPAAGRAVWISPNDLNTTTVAEIVSVLVQHSDASVPMSYPSTTGSTGVKHAFTGGDLRTRYTGFWYARDYAVQVRIVVTRYEAGYTLPAHVTTPARSAVTTYFAGLRMGSALAQNDLLGAVTAVSGIGRATVEYRKQANPGTDPDSDTWGAWISTDTVPDPADRFVLHDTVGVT